MGAEDSERSQQPGGVAGLERWTRAFTRGPDDVDASAEIRDWHGEIEARVRENLARAARQRARPPQLAEAT